MTDVFSTFKHLLSRSQAWRLVADPLKSYIKGFSYFPANLRDHIDRVWLDNFPDETREVEKWEQQFGLLPTGTAQERIAKIKGAWMAQGGQGLDYLQNLIHDSGYPQIFLHEWWEADDAYRTYCLAPDSDCGSDAAECGVVLVNGAITTRDPNDWLDDIYLTYCLAPDSDCGSDDAECGGVVYESKLLVNKGPELASSDYATYCLAPDSDCGSDDAECGVLIEISFTPIEYAIPQNPVQWRYIIYAGAETFGDIAEVPLELQGEFERLLLGKLPYQQWIGLLVNYT